MCDLIYIYPGYHWDCSDWALVEDQSHARAATLNLHEVSTCEVQDSESNSENSQIELLTTEERRRLNRAGSNRRKGFVGSSLTSLENGYGYSRASNSITNGLTEEDEDIDDDETLHAGSNGRSNETSALLGLDDIEFADQSPSSENKYAAHPNSYLPVVYCDSTNGDVMNGSDTTEGGFDGSGQWNTSNGDVDSMRTRSALTTTNSSTDNVSLTAVSVTNHMISINGKKPTTVSNTNQENNHLVKSKLEQAANGYPNHHRHQNGVDNHSDQSSCICDHNTHIESTFV